MFQFFQKGISLLVGAALTAAGFIGTIDALKGRGGFWGGLHTFFQDPWIYLPTMAFGLLFLCFSLASWRASQLFKNAGGPTKKEFPANFRSWDKVENFTVSQLAWLWNGLEPQNAETQGTVTYSTYRVFKEHLAAGRIMGAQKVNGSWLTTTLSRQQVIDYALEVGERPLVLFVDERRPWLIRVLNSFFRNEVQKYDLGNYSPLSNLTSAAVQVLGQENEQVAGAMPHAVPLFNQDLERFRQVQSIIRDLMFSQKWEAIGRLQHGKFLYHYEKIPFWKWEFAEPDWSQVRWGTQVYKDVLVRNLTS